MGRHQLYINADKVELLPDFREHVEPVEVREEWFRSPDGAELLAALRAADERDGTEVMQ